MGPVSKEALIRIGMDEREAQRVMKYIQGLAEDDPKPKEKETGRRKKEHEKAQKEIFRKLLAEGLPASLSLELSGMAVKGQVQMIRNKLGALTELNSDKKQRIMQLCAGPF